MNNNYAFNFTTTMNLQEQLDNYPDDVIDINFQYKTLGYLPELSRFKNLKILCCFDTKLQEIYNLPSRLEYLDCCYNQLKNLPELPFTLTFLNCSVNILTTLPKLPIKLNKLVCFDNKLTKLPKLPESLTELKCSVNKLTNIPDLPNSLKILQCNNNKLILLPEVILTSLIYINCANNLLIKLPKLPQNLQTLDCSINYLREIPILPPKLRILFCSYNNLTGILPDLPYTINDNSMLEFYFNNLIYNMYTVKCVNITNQKIRNFKYTFYCLKFKSKFRNWLWDKVRRPKIESLCHPLRITGLLEKGIDIMDLDIHLEKNV